VQTLVQNESLCLPAVLRGIVEAVSDAESLGAKEAQVLQVSTKLAAKGVWPFCGKKGPDGRLKVIPGKAPRHYVKVANAIWRFTERCLLHGMVCGSARKRRV
jgi:hypothetical protein